MLMHSHFSESKMLFFSNYAYKYILKTWFPFSEMVTAPINCETVHIEAWLGWTACPWSYHTEDFSPFHGILSQSWQLVCSVNVSSGIDFKQTKVVYLWMAKLIIFLSLPIPKSLELLRNICSRYYKLCLLHLSWICISETSEAAEPGINFCMHAHIKKSINQQFKWQVLINPAFQSTSTVLCLFTGKQGPLCSWGLFPCT